MVTFVKSRSEQRLEVAANKYEQVRQFATSAGPLAADAVVITLPPLILVLATGRWLLRGLAEGVQR